MSTEFDEVDDAEDVPGKWTMKAADLNCFWLKAYPILIGKFWSGKLDRDRFTQASTMKSEINRQLREDCHLKNLKLKLPKGMDVRPFGPIRYNFLLSNMGLLLPLPPEPPGASKDEKEQSAIDIFRKYQYRSVGPPMIRVPGLKLKCGANFGDVGPWFFSKAEMGELIDFFGLSDGNSASIAMKLADLFDYENSPVDMALVMLFQREASIAFGRNETQTWSISGAQYMQIMTAYPRIVAHAWFDQQTLERTMSQSNRPLPPGEFAEFKRRLLNQRTDDECALDLTRQLIEEYAELTTHPNMRITVKEGRKKNRVSHKGLDLALPKAPDLDEMIESWANGTAGNPVFTMST